ncbi:diaminobutyrate acetyltransferase [Cohnella luojiensis]|uniref:L-2,4-diaminobutyric acid acetyltransferase n=1 Tax=Cohnella luojiensis TaxID=652876 RepID=A0A4Y8LUJ9_9BACL|nr:diaminobutyrate acetyltransferase [Cohnella luojiensis]TFE23448.1 diaminobutyrate acetyltransferase [Cohnella luojiensis]
MRGLNHRLPPLVYRIPGQEDGPRIWEMVRDSRNLDLNSSYFYLTMSRWFSLSCRVAVETESNTLIGFVIGFRQPEQPDTLFIWQIAVEARYRGKGIARKLLDEVTGLPDIRFVEATVAPSNIASRSLFLKWAQSHESSAVLCSGFGEDCFPGNEHEREDLFRIGPLSERRGPRRRSIDESIAIEKQ